MMLSTMTAEAAADAIHPSVTQLGLKRIVQQEQGELVGESPRSCWSNGDNERHWLAARLKKTKHLRDLAKSGGDDFSLTSHPYHEEKRLSDPVDNRVLPPLKLTDTQLVAFHRQWSHATQLYSQIQAELRPMHDVFLCFSLMCLFLPLELAVLSVTNPNFSLNGGYGAVAHASNTVRVLLISIMPSLATVDLLCAARCTFRLRSTVRNLVGLTYARSHDRMTVDHITRQPDQCTWYITGLQLPVAPRSLLVPLAVLAVSAVPWAWVRFTAAAG